VKFKPIPDDISEKVEVDELCESGLRWKNTPEVHHKVRGKPAGHKNVHGYWHVKHKGKLYKNHRVIWFLINDVDPAECQVDHRDRNPSNNKIENLRLCTHRQNQRNRGKHKNNRHKYKGVSKNTRGYQARIRIKGKQIHLGTFATQEEAASRYNQAALKHHGEFARLNVI